MDTVASEGLKGEADADVWDAAQREARSLITQDLDFSDVRRFRPGTHATLDEEALRAVIAFAASAEEDFPVPPAPSIA